MQLGQKYLIEWQRTGGAEDRPTPDEKLLDSNQVKLLEEEIKLAELQAADAKKSYESGRGALTDVIKAKRDLLALRRLLPENAGPAQRKALIEEEIKYVEQLLKEVQKTIEVGAAPLNAEIPVKRDLLALRRELPAVGSLSQQPGAEGSIEQRQIRQQASTDEEAREVEHLKEIIRNSPDLINAKRDGYAPLHTAATKGQLVVVRFLLDNGASINSRNNSGETPLHLAVSQGHKAMVELLLSGGADVKARTARGEAPLHYAAAKGFMAVAKVLLEKGAEVNAKNSQNETALIGAAKEGFGDIVSLLLAKHARVDILEGNGGNLEVIELEPIEPALFLYLTPEAAQGFADAVRSAASRLRQ